VQNDSDKFAFFQVFCR